MVSESGAMTSRRSAPGTKERTTILPPASCSPRTAKGSGCAAATIRSTSSAGNPATLALLLMSDLMQGQVPDVGGVAADCPIRGEPADIGGVEHGTPHPVVMVAECVIDPALCRDIAGEVGRHHEIVAVQQAIDELSVAIGLPRRKFADGN